MTRGWHRLWPQLPSVKTLLWFQPRQLLGCWLSDLTSEVLTDANPKGHLKPKEHSCGGRGGILIMTAGQKNPTLGAPTSCADGSLEGLPCRPAGTREMGEGWKQPEAQSPAQLVQLYVGHWYIVLFIC